MKHISEVIQKLINQQDLEWEKEVKNSLVNKNYTEIEQGEIGLDGFLEILEPISISEESK